MLVSRTGLWMTRDSNAYDENLIPNEVAASSDDDRVTIRCANNLDIMSYASNITMGAYGNEDVVVVSSNTVIINGDVRITGGLESYTETELRIQDKLIRLSYPLDSNFSAADADIAGAGIILANSDDNSGAEEKSFRWDSEVWNVKGGNLALRDAFLFEATEKGADNGELRILRRGQAGLAANRPLVTIGSSNVLHAESVYPFGKLIYN
jgi:hypothetical protein